MVKNLGFYIVICGSCGKDNSFTPSNLEGFSLLAWKRLKETPPYWRCLNCVTCLDPVIRYNPHTIYSTMTEEL